ncbi:MAG: SHOCT domain-containing protein [Acidimicrobiales bacterium]
MLAYDYPLLGFFWSLFMLFIWLAWILLVFRIVIDIFRDRNLSGVAKALWVLFVAFLPFLGVLLYLITRGNGMAQRELDQAVAQKEAFDQYVRSAAGGTADELAKLADLKAQGVISDQEFEAQKAKLLA